MTFHVDDHDARIQHENGDDDELFLPRDEHGGLQRYDRGSVYLGKLKKLVIRILNKYQNIKKHFIRNIRIILVSKTYRILSL